MYPTTNSISSRDITFWHITTATHNSRYSQRMFNYHIPRGTPRWIGEIEELVITKTFAEIVKSDNLTIPAYNICGDHMHFILVCNKEEVSKIVGKIKAMTARSANRAMGYTDTTMGHAPLSRHVPLPSRQSPSSEQIPLSSKKEREQRSVHLWTQKFGKKQILDRSQYMNTIRYIQNNRIKHHLPVNSKLQEIIDNFVSRYRI